MQLFERIMQGKKTTYREHHPKPINVPYLESRQAATLLSVLTLSMLMSVEGQLPPHATLARRVKKVEESVKELAQLTGEPLDPVLIAVGVGAWNAAMHSMQVGLGGGHA